MQPVSVSFDIAKYSDFREKILMSAEIKEYVMLFIYFFDLF